MFPVIYLPSPNFSARGDAAVSMLVLHYTGMKSAADALARLCDVQAQVSAHYVIDEDGKVYQLVEEQHCAWHAGASYWRGNKNVNNISIGIEIVNPGYEFGYRPFPAVQMQAVAGLCSDIIARHQIQPVNVVGHSDVAPLRKEDPGELFDWQWLAGQGIGVWPSVSGQWQEGTRARGGVLYDDPAGEISRSEIGGDAPPINNKFVTLGYEIPDREDGLNKVITAFQRHFRPSAVNGVWDAECDERLAALLAMI